MDYEELFNDIYENFYNVPMQQRYTTSCVMTTSIIEDILSFVNNPIIICSRKIIIDSARHYFEANELAKNLLMLTFLGLYTKELNEYKKFDLKNNIYNFLGLEIPIEIINTDKNLMIIYDKNNNKTYCIKTV
jgi:hypothetical protein